MSEHTPGPWTVELWLASKPENGAYVRMSSTELISLDEEPLSLPDARLIAAAPDLLAACNTFLKYCKRRDGSLADFEHAMMAFVEDGSALQESIDAISSAVAKAEGREP